MIIFVGNLNKLTTERELKDLFAAYGIVKKLRIMVDKITRRSRGYAYVEMEEDGAAFNSINRLNSTSFMGSFLIVGAATAGQLTKVEWS